MAYFELGKKTTVNLETILQSGKPASKILVETVKEFIQYTPIDFCIIKSGGLRTAEEQKALYDKKVSKCDGFINLSKHQSGLAVDLVPWVDGKATWSPKEAFYLAGAFVSFCKIRQIIITSGADWDGNGNIRDGWDPCHMEIKE